MRAVVTGGAGFVGSNIVDALVDAGAEVLVIDDLSRGTRANLEHALGRGARLVELDVRDGPAVDEAFRSFRPELVFHLAAQIDVRVSMDEPARGAAVNVLGSVIVFSAAHAVGARRVVNTSTGGAIYGESEVVPTSEAVAADPPTGPVRSGRWRSRSLIIRPTNNATSTADKIQPRIPSPITAVVLMKTPRARPDTDDVRIRR